MQKLGFTKKLPSTLARIETKFLFLVFAIFSSLLGCVENGEPAVQDLIKVKAPFFSSQVPFNGKMTATFTTPSINYTLTGKCDRASYKLEYSDDNGSTWSVFATECVGGVFHLPLIVEGYREVLLRAKGKFSYTEVVMARIRFLLPPTSRALFFAASSKSDKSDRVGVGTQNIMADTFSGESASSASTTFKTYLPELAYE